MNASEKDVPLSIALLAASAVAVAWWYCTYLRFHPDAGDRIAMGLEQHSQFWCTALIAAALNVALVGSWLRRTVGMQKQGSRLMQLEHEGFRFRIRLTDLYASLFAVASGLLSVAYATSATSPFTSIGTVQAIAGLTWSLCMNFGLAALSIAAPVLRKISELKMKSDGPLSPPPFEKLCLVLGTTPVLE